MLDCYVIREQEHSHDLPARIENGLRDKSGQRGFVIDVVG